MEHHDFGGYSCIASMPSVTPAMRAERVLATAGIDSRVISLLPGETKKGCAFGLSYPCEHDRRVRALLREAQISVGQYLKRGASL